MHSFAPSDITPDPLTLTKNQVQITPSVSSSYDDNIFRVSDSADAKTVYIISPRVDAKLDRVFGSNQLSISATAAYDYFVNATSISRPMYAVKGLDTFRPLGSCSATPYFDYQRQRSDYGDINASINNNQNVARFGAIATCARPSGLFPSLGYEHYITRDSNDSFKFADQSTNTYIGGIGYRKPSFGQVILYYRRDNVFRPLLGIHNDSNREGMSFRRSISSLVSADVDLSYISVESSDEAIPDYRGLGWHIELTTRLLPLARVSISTSRSIVNDSLLSSGFVVQSSYGAVYNYAISDLTAISLTANYLTRNLKQDPSQARAGLAKDRYLVAGAEIRRNLSSKFVISLNGNHYLRRANVGLSDFDANRITLGCQLTF